MIDSMRIKVHHETLIPEQRWQLPELRETTHKTAQEYAYLRLRHAIMVGGVPPGVALTIRAVASAMSLSPTPVREALKRLCAEGALQSQSNRRIITPPMTAPRHRELIHTRVALEHFAVSRAMRYVTDIDVEKMTDLDLQMDSAITAQDYSSLVVLNQQFHSHLYQLNPEQVCMPMIESVWLQFGPYNRVAAQRVGEIVVEDWHKHLLIALRVRDKTAALAAIEADILDGASSLEELLPQA